MLEIAGSVSRRAALARLGGALASLVAAAAVPARAGTPPRRVEMFRTSGCGCCLLWAEHLRKAGFVVDVRELATAPLARMKRDAGLTPDQHSCHTAFVEGYVIEGHVPAADILRLIAERPEAAGLTVPGMPIGSPGMESGTRREAFEVLLFRKGGPPTTYATYPAQG